MEKPMHKSKKMPRRLPEAASWPNGRLNKVPRFKRVEEWAAAPAVVGLLSTIGGRGLRLVIRQPCLLSAFQKLKAQNNRDQSLNSPPHLVFLRLLPLAMHHLSSICQLRPALSWLFLPELTEIHSLPRLWIQIF